MFEVIWTLLTVYMRRNNEFLTDQFCETQFVFPKLWIPTEVFWFPFLNTMLLHFVESTQTTFYTNRPKRLAKCDGMNESSKRKRIRTDRHTHRNFWKQDRYGPVSRLL